MEVFGGQSSDICATGYKAYDHGLSWMHRPDQKMQKAVEEIANPACGEWLNCQSPSHLGCQASIQGFIEGQHLSPDISVTERISIRATRGLD